METKNYKDSLNLPKTDFSMKANLTQREPQFITQWEKENIYHKIINSRMDKKPFILHDGPPYANGNIHIGHALNKILKDIIVKFRTMEGYYSPYIPGWDCHGLPIEHQVVKNLGDKAKSTPLDIIRKKCREYANKFIEVQKKEFKRLGVFGDYENPYLTMSLDYEADILEALALLLEKGYIYKGLKPVYWCGHCNTALAEAEIEYNDKQSPSIFVKFPVEKASFTNESNVFVIIWTTTPWTLPANVAISFHPDYEYALIKVKDEYYILAKDLMESVAKQTHFSFEFVKILKKKDLSTMVIRHPFISERIVKPVFGAHVTLDTGTGAVHTAPGHGQEDYEMSKEYNLPILSPVDKDARFTTEVKEWAGLPVFEANSKIIERLQNDQKLVFTETITHSYPHCWRCKNPVIFRATPQWFISIDHKNLRKKLIDVTEKEVKWFPDWGSLRLSNMLTSRPDWCISRQRSWGVPIPAVYCKDCGETILTAETVKKVSHIVRKEGLDVWFTKSIDYFLGKDIKCSKCGSIHLEKEGDILDVWFDSGVSWYAVINRRNLPGASMYLEGSDQHRGWFQSSLIPSVAISGKAPYKEVLTHGFMLDEHGKAMHKSAGNVVAPEEIIKEYGADILRLWVTTQDYKEDLRIGKNLLNQTADAYRKIRNTFRFILGNIYDFNPKKDKVALKDLNPIDQWAISKLRQVVKSSVEDYRSYNFNTVYKTIYHFTNIELSAFYFDVLKDLLYTSKKSGKDRRSSQTAMFEIGSALTRLIAPILVFTTEELWKNISKDEESVHLQYFPKVEDYLEFKEIENDFETLIAVRDDVLKALDIARNEKIIGASLEAQVELEISDNAIKKLLEKYKTYLSTYFIVSNVTFQISPDIKINHQGKHVKIGVKQAKGEKCPRCWKYKDSIGANKEHLEICQECASAIRN